MWLFGTGLLLLIGTPPSQGLYKRWGYLIALISYVQDFLCNWKFLQVHGAGHGKGLWNNMRLLHTGTDLCKKKELFCPLFNAKSLKVHFHENL